MGWALGEWIPAAGSVLLVEGKMLCYRHDALLLGDSDDGVVVSLTSSNTVVQYIQLYITKN